jgi:xanthine dehydrogenase accessory factor
MSLNWHTQLSELQEQGRACVIVTIFALKGSTPRALGSKMLVCEDKNYLSIGGGHLEHQATKLAQQMLDNKEQQSFIKSFSLGASLGQCCGGQVELLFEAFYPLQRQVAIFGAGHIASALVPILAQLPSQVIWSDSRALLFPTTTLNNTKIVINDDLCSVIDQLHDDCYVLIMTHNHQLDQNLCEALLKRQHKGFIGVIGSTTKWKKFKLRLLNKGFDEMQVSRICCPIGHSDVGGKLPIEIAVSVSAQFIQHYQNAPAIASQSISNNTDGHIKSLP